MRDDTKEFIAFVIGITILGSIIAICTLIYNLRALAH